MIEFSSGYLLTVRRKALRSRTWFTVLDGPERAILSLVPKCIDRVKSPKLIDIVAKIIVKVEEALNNSLERVRSLIAKPLVLKISGIAEKWGYRNAGKWVSDEGFIRYLTVMTMNDSLFFR